MRHLRADYDAIQPWPVKRPHTAKINGETQVEVGDWQVNSGQVKPLIPDDEPVFLIRGQDPTAAFAVRSYAYNAEQCGADAQFVRQVYAWADVMEKYAEAKQHGAPDVPEGMLRNVIEDKES